MKISYLVFGLMMAFFMACQNQPLQKEETKGDNKEIQHDEEHGGINEVQLNNGQKWPANAETTTGIQNMAALISDFSDTDKMDDCKALKAQLILEFDMLIQKCTMTGEGHEQLHNYLIPLRNQFEALNSPDCDECLKAIDAIRQHLDAYGNYFV